jgi:TonB family protein
LCDWEPEAPPVVPILVYFAWPARAFSLAGVFALAAGLGACGGASSAGGTAPAPSQAHVDGAASSQRKREGLSVLQPDDPGYGMYGMGTSCGCMRPVGVNGSDPDGDYRRKPPEHLPSAPVDPLPPETRGGLDRETVRWVVRRHRRELLACYPAATRDRNVFGMLMVDFTIAPSGEVRVASLRHQTTGDDQIASCFVEAIRAWRFPRAPHGEETVVAQRFTLFARRGRFPWPRHDARK